MVIIIVMVYCVQVRNYQSTVKIIQLKTTLRCQTLDETIALYSIDHGTVNISKPPTLSPTIGVDNAVVSEVKPSKCDETKSWSKRKSKFHDDNDEGKYYFIGK